MEGSINQMGVHHQTSHPPYLYWGPVLQDISDISKKNSLFYGLLFCSLLLYPKYFTYEVLSLPTCSILKLLCMRMCTQKLIKKLCVPAKSDKEHRR